MERAEVDTRPPVSPSLLPARAHVERLLDAAMEATPETAPDLEEAVLDFLAGFAPLAPALTRAEGHAELTLALEAFAPARTCC